MLLFFYTYFCVTSYNTIKQLTAHVSTNHYFPYQKITCKHWFKTAADIHYQLNPDELTQQTLNRGEGVLNDTGPIVIKTGRVYRPQPKDKYTVKDEITKDSVHWNDFLIYPLMKIFLSVKRKDAELFNRKENFG